MTIKIEKGIPIAKKAKGKLMNSYPFDQMQVGDSFFIPFSSIGKKRNHRYMLLF